MLNNLLGYFMVWGYDYTVELVDMEQADYRDAIEKGEVDLVLYGRHRRAGHGRVVERRRR